MPRANFRDAISQAVTYINNMGSIDDLGQSAIKQGVVLRVLSAAGWDAFDLSEVRPDYRSGNTKVDFALMPTMSGRGRTGDSPLALIEVKSFQENLESDRYERQMMAHCSRENVPLAVLTNGRRWLLYFWSENTQAKDNRFCDIDLGEEPESVVNDINRYLSKDRVSSGQASRSAERALQDRNRDEVTRKAILDGWRQVVRGLDEGLIELVSVACEQRTGDRPENRFVRRVLMEHRAELIPSTEDDDLSHGIGGSRSARRRPASFTLGSETQPVGSWPELLVSVCEIMRDRHPQDFERILEIRGRSLPYFSKSEDEVHLPREIGDSGIFASCQGAGVLIEGRAKRVVELFGHSAESLEVQLR